MASRLQPQYRAAAAPCHLARFQSWPRTGTRQPPPACSIGHLHTTAHMAVNSASTVPTVMFDFMRMAPSTEVMTR
eukprot:1913751-Rhodomonas_salina.3